MSRGSDSGRGKWFSLLQSTQTGPRGNPSSHLMGTWGFSPGLKRSRPEVDHSPLSSVEVKNEYSLPPFNLHAFMACAVSIGSVLSTRYKIHGFLYCPCFKNHSLGDGHDLVPYAVVSGHAKVQVTIFWILTMNLRFNPNWLHMKSVAHELAVVAVSFFYFSLLIIIQTLSHNHHWILRYAITLTRQHITTSSVVKFQPSLLWPSIWFVTE